jgi:hypothetical protein
LSSADGYVYESGDAAAEFTIQSISKAFTYALALDRIGQDAVDARIGVEPSGEAFNEISVDKTTKTPKKHAGRALRPDPGLLLRIRRPASRAGRRGVRVREGLR